MTSSTQLSSHTASASRTEMAFVTDNLPDFQQLVAGLRPGVQVVVLDSTRDALAQMVQALHGQTDLAAIHLLSHGAAGRIDLGALTLSSDNLNDYQAQLAQIGASLAADGDLLVYGCSVGESGAFVAQLASLTQADVAASDDLTGASALGGNWVLEISTGQIETKAALTNAAMQGYDHTMPLPAITSATYDAATGTVVVTGTDFVAFAGSANDVDVTQLKIRGEGGSLDNPHSSSDVEITSSTSFTVVLSAADIEVFNTIINKDGTTATGGATYSLTAGANFLRGATTSDGTAQALTVSHIPVPTITSATYAANTGVLVVTGTGLSRLDGSNNDILASKLQVTGQAGGTYTLTDTGDADMASTTSFTMTLSVTDKAAVNALLNNNGTISLGGTTFNLAALEDWDAAADGALTIADLTGNGITVSGINIAPTITNLGGDTVALSGTVALDSGTALTISDTENDAANWNGASLTVQRILMGGSTADPGANDVFTLNANGFTNGGAGLQSGGLTFATYTNNGGVLRISFTGTGTNATNTLVQDVMRGVRYANSKPYGDATLRYVLNDGTATTSADVTVTSSTITVDRTDAHSNGDDSGGDAADGFSLREALARGVAQAGADTLKLAGLPTGSTITLTGSAATLGDGDMLDFTGTSGNQLLSIAGSSGVGLTLAGVGKIAVGGGTPTLTISADISGAGSLEKLNPKLLVLSGNNTYAGSTTISAGGLTVNGGAAIPDISAVTVASGATLTLGASETVGSLAGAGNAALGANTLTAGGDGTSTSFSGVVSGTGSLIKTGSGTLTLSGANTYTGTTTISAGGLTVSGGYAIANTSAVTVASGATLTLNTDEAIGSLAGAGNTALGAKTLTAGGDGTSTTFSGVASGTGGLIKKGSGTLTLSGTNTYTGATTISVGELTVSGGAAIANTSAVTVFSGAKLTLVNNETMGSLASAGNVALGANTLTAGGNNTDTTFSGVASGTGSLVKAGTGKWVLSGANTYTGTTTVLGGELNIASHNNISSGNVLLDGGMLSLTGESGTGNGINDLSGSVGTDADFFANNIAIGANGGNLFASGPQWILMGALTGSGPLTKSGGGYLMINGTGADNASGFSGNITVSSSAIGVYGNNTLGTGQLTLASDTIVYIGGNSKTLPNNIVLAGNASLQTDAQDIYLSGQPGFAANAVATLSGVISESGSPRVLTLKNYSATNAFILSGSNTYTGGTVLNENIKVFVSADANLGVGGSVTLEAGSVLSVTADATFNHAMVLAGAATLEVGSGLAATFSGVVSGGYNLSKAGTGVLTLSGTNTYSGTTAVNAGTLWVDGALSGAGAVSVASGATLDGSGSIAGAVTASTGSTVSGGTTTTAGSLTLNGGLALAGSLSEQIGGTSAGSFDKLVVNGAVTLTNATLDASFIGGFSSATGNSFTLIDNDLTDPASGTFTGLAEGATFTSGGRTLKISYVGGDGNDVVLTDVTPNTAPTLSGVPVTAQAVTTGTAAALADFTVADADGAGVTLNVTLTATNGTINAVADADTNTAGIQLSGTAAALNTALAAATFTAAAAGAASISISVDDGQAAAVTATYNLVASAVVIPAPVNSPPTGSVTLSGTATQGQTLTVANTLADLNGLGAISYQWMAGGVDIAGATATSFTLTQAEVGKAITAVARYTDAQGTIESVASGATATVANVNDLPTGNVTLSGTATQGQTLTVANTLADLDGLGAISYQWMAGSVNITGATATTFTLTQAEVGKSITAVALYTDAQGTIESVASGATAVVAKLNDFPPGGDTGGDTGSTPGSNTGNTIEDTVPGLPPANGGSPVTGDGNGDGIADSKQVQVTSLSILNTATAQSAPGNATTVFVSLVVDSIDGKPNSANTTPAEITSLVQKDAPAGLPAELKLPLGLLSFSVSVPSSASNSPVNETFSLYVDLSTGANGYWVQDANQIWCNLASAAYGGQMVEEGGKLRLDFKLVDGGAFDTDGVTNGSIGNLGAPGNMPLSMVGFSPAVPAGQDFWF